MASIYLSSQAPEPLQVALFVRGPVLTLRLPQRLRKTLDHLVLGVMPVAGRLEQACVDLANAGWSVGRDLLAQGQVHAHVQERIGLAAPGQEVSIDVLACDDIEVFGMFGNDVGDLLL